MDKSKELANLIPAFDKTKVIGFDPSVKNPAVVVCDLNERGFIDEWIFSNVNKTPAMVIDLDKDPNRTTVEKEVLDLLSITGYQNLTPDWLSVLKRPGSTIVNKPSSESWVKQSPLELWEDYLFATNEINVGTIGCPVDDIKQTFLEIFTRLRQPTKTQLNNWFKSPEYLDEVVLKYSKESDLQGSVELSVAGVIVWSTPYGFPVCGLLIPGKAKYQQRTWFPSHKNHGLLKLRNLITKLS